MEDMKSRNMAKAKKIAELMCTPDGIESVKELLYCRFNSAKETEAMREAGDTPLKDYKGYTMSVWIFAGNDTNVHACVKVDEKLQKMLGMDTEKLFETALRNTEKLFPALTNGFADEVFTAMGAPAPKEVTDDRCMFIASNEVAFRGTSVILYDGYLKQVSDKFDGNNLWLLPSSVHEWVVCPSFDLENKEERFKNLTDMVRDINKTEVNETDVLGETPLYYCRETDSIMTYEELAPAV